MYLSNSLSGLENLKKLQFGYEFNGGEERIVWNQENEQNEYLFYEKDNVLYKFN